jgi:Phytanoyl-CoA dioxygenase (PhyH)
MITHSDVESYRERGYIVVPDVLDAAAVAALRTELAGILEGARHVTAHTDVYDLEPGHGAGDPRVRRVKAPHKFFSAFERLYRYPRLVQILTALLGPSVRLHGSKINVKAPRYARRWNGTRTGRATLTRTTTSWPWASCWTTARATTAR